jgi:hypothetical protein
MGCTAVKFAPRFNDQKQQCVNMCLKLQEKANEDPTFMSISRIITGDEGWIYGYDPETKKQLSQWKSPQSSRAKQTRQVWSSTKSMVIALFDVKGIVCHEFVPPNTMVNFYCDVSRHLREMCNEKDRNFGATTTGSFIMTTQPPTRP